MYIYIFFNRHRIYVLRGFAAKKKDIDLSC